MKAPKAASAQACTCLEQLPNIGPALAADLRGIGIEHPAQLVSQDGWNLYQTLCLRTARRHDPCVLDTFLAACDFMRGAAPLPWWKYTPRRKAEYQSRLDALSMTLSLSSPRMGAQDAAQLSSNASSSPLHPQPRAIRHRHA